MTTKETRAVTGYYLALLPNNNEEDFPFTIHGLWPQFDANHWPEFCKKQSFDLGRLRPLLPKLHKEWHNYQGRDEDFWEKEWVKHGTCTGMTEIEYFTRAIECYENCKLRGVQWVLTHFSDHTYKIPVNLDFDIGHLVF